MKRFSNLLFYTFGSVIIIESFYTRFSGENYEFMQWLSIVSLTGMIFGYALNALDRYSALMVFGGNSRKYSFLMHAPLSHRFYSWSNLSFGTSIFFGLFFGAVLFFLVPQSYYSGVVLLISGVDKLGYFVLCRSRSLFRAGISENMIVMNNGGLQIIPFHQLKSIEMKYDELLFIYSNGKVNSVFYPVVNSKDHPDFCNQLTALADKKGIAVPNEIRMKN